MRLFFCLHDWSSPLWSVLDHWSRLQSDIEYLLPLFTFIPSLHLSLFLPSFLPAFSLFHWLWRCHTDIFNFNCCPWNLTIIFKLSNSYCFLANQILILMISMNLGNTPNFFFKYPALIKKIGVYIHIYVQQ